jgi:hypothetical protein
MGWDGEQGGARSLARTAHFISQAQSIRGCDSRCPPCHQPPRACRSQPWCCLMAMRRRLMMLCVGLRDLNTRINHCARGIKIQRRAFKDLFLGAESERVSGECAHTSLALGINQRAVCIHIETPCVVAPHFCNFSLCTGKTMFEIIYDPFQCRVHTRYSLDGDGRARPLTARSRLFH